MKSLPRGLRNNNPGNIRITKDKWQGLREKQTDKDFFQFTEDSVFSKLQKWNGVNVPWSPHYRITEGNTTVFVLRTLLQDGPHRQRTIQGLTSDGYVRICKYLRYMFRILRIKIRCALWLLLYLMLKMVSLP